MKSVTQIASHDISEYIHSEFDKVIDGNFDCWVVFGRYLFTKEQKRLNRELGIHKINKSCKK